MGSAVTRGCSGVWGLAPMGPMAKHLVRGSGDEASLGADGNIEINTLFLVMFLFNSANICCITKFV